MSNVYVWVVSDVYVEPEHDVLSPVKVSKEEDREQINLEIAQIEAALDIVESPEEMEKLFERTAWIENEIKEKEMKNSDLTVQTYMHFDPEQHLYSIRRVDTDEIVQELISTTQIMEKHGISVNYDSVPEHVMEQAKLFGKIHHKYLEKYFRGEALIEELPEVTQEGNKVVRIKEYDTYRKRTKN